METLQLIAHPAFPPLRVRGMTARVLSCDAQWCVLRWKVDGAVDLVVPAFAGRARADGLWHTTCFELFIQPAPHTRPAHPERGEGVGQGGQQAERAQSYTEYNFSPSERWAAYEFTAYRAGMVARAMARGPVITPRRGSDVLFCDVAIPMPGLPPLPWRYGLTAVIEEAGGVKSFWAAAHPREQPDFHDPACLIATLAAPISPASSPRA